MSAGRCKASEGCNAQATGKTLLRDGRRVRSCSDHRRVRGGVPKVDVPAEYLAITRRAAWSMVTPEMLARWGAGASARYSDAESVDRATDRALDGFVRAVGREAYVRSPGDARAGVRAVKDDAHLLARLVNAAGRSGDGRTDVNRGREVPTGIVGTSGGQEGADPSRWIDPEARTIDREVIARAVGAVRGAERADSDAVRAAGVIARAVRHGSHDAATIGADILADILARPDSADILADVRNWFAHV